MGKIYTKNTIFDNFLGCKPTFIKPKRQKFGVRCEAGRPSPYQILQKKLVKEVYPFSGKLYQKLAILAILTPVSPHFQSHNREVWREATDLGHLSMPNFVKIAQGPAGIALSRKGDAY